MYTFLHDDDGMLALNSLPWQWNEERVLLHESIVIKSDTVKEPIESSKRARIQHPAVEFDIAFPSHIIDESGESRDDVQLT